MSLAAFEIEWSHTATEPQPVWLSLGNGVPGDSPLRLVPADGESASPVQRLGDDRGVALLAPRAGSHRFQLEAGPAETGTGVSARRADGERIALWVGGELFGYYHFSPTLARPFIYPVFGPDGTPVTRHFPMRGDVTGEKRDHSHHRSFWTAYGELSDTDNWSEGKGHAFVRHVALEQLIDGPVCGGFQVHNRWIDPSDRPQVDERRRTMLYQAGPDRRLLDYEVTFISAHGDVHFGDTKEGGIISFRVATSMDGDRGGMIENADGGRREEECWGRRSAWCDYSGNVAGNHVGIAVMDHPENLRHPAYWHVRDYGLMTANPFGTSTFENDDGKRGEFTLPAGAELQLRYRVLIHRGGARDGYVAEAWQAYADPPTVRTLGR